MAKTMTKHEWRKFVSEGTRTAKLSTVRADGSPHVAPVWFLLDGDELVFNTDKESVKGRSLRRDGRVAICVEDDDPPFAFALLQGQAEVSEDPEQALHWATQIAARYMGEDVAQSVGERNSGPGALTVRVRVAKVTAVAELTE
ncbi:PPOX class F420-dependent oxidoreductase [Streptomyces albipurpureus]|uniref:PPOX class F420-dependent oxidoreductase n=1 Tax=Streptomyces albipurpureus TaxID=2897419 RepID=A0ABT0UNS7_9ACTN|nr:PPOX class F420-dependent oxidoreductase [Streptomyces sp. CWNU-1]MCM2389987.1 PPOX class F420-dependent oxidoreductase [Streptomyces sp. CWNU-1]